MMHNMASTYQLSGWSKRLFNLKIGIMPSVIRDLPSAMRVIGN